MLLLQAIKQSGKSTFRMNLMNLSKGHQIYHEDSLDKAKPADHLKLHSTKDGDKITSLKKTTLPGWRNVRKERKTATLLMEEGRNKQIEFYRLESPQIETTVILMLI